MKLIGYSRIHVSFLERIIWIPLEFLEFQKWRGKERITQYCMIDLWARIYFGFISNSTEIMFVENCK